jgi:homoserine O-acetyltransferase
VASNSNIQQTAPNGSDSAFTDPQFHGATVTTPPELTLSPSERKHPSTYFSAQSYLRYQGNKFVKRFDSNCYIAITRKLDTHDVSRYRVPLDSPDPIRDALGLLEQPTLVLGIESDGLFTFAEQEELAECIPNARLRRIESPEGHDAFLLQFEQVNKHILDFLHEVLPDIMDAPGIEGVSSEEGVGAVTKTSTFGEAEVEDITAW